MSTVCPNLNPNVNSTLTVPHDWPALTTSVAIHASPSNHARNRPTARWCHHHLSALWSAYVRKVTLAVDQPLASLQCQSQQSAASQTRTVPSNVPVLIAFAETHVTAAPTPSVASKTTSLCAHVPKASKETRRLNACALVVAAMTSAHQRTAALTVNAYPPAVQMAPPAASMPSATESPTNQSANVLQVQQEIHESPA